MTRSHVLALLGGIGIGIGVGAVALLLIVNRALYVAPPTPVVPAPPVAAFAPQAVAPVKPIVHTHLRKPVATADARRTLPPAAKLPSIPSPVQIGDGTIFSGVDPNDPRIYHFAD